jgi:hypothetical protein
MASIMKFARRGTTAQTAHSSTVGSIRRTFGKQLCRLVADWLPASSRPDRKRLKILPGDLLLCDGVDTIAQSRCVYVCLRLVIGRPLDLEGRRQVGRAQKHGISHCARACLTSACA